MGFPEYTINSNFESSIYDYFSREHFPPSYGRERGLYVIIRHLTPLTI